ncbi:uncharacterized protein PRCAT00006044001 [Priceomyces carsonii]|uniref:uncharacterized protein n=1 Tax=Priceomyces carsonii TaxID=28549 RepID=UPI002ED864EB|nr:unnamed protein product [Priceomyces carsonii]
MSIYGCLQRQSIRVFSLHCSILRQIYTRTTLNPTNFTLREPKNISSKCVLVLATQNVLHDVIKESLKHHEKTDLQIVVAGIDSVTPNSQRNGVSEMWLDQYVKLHDANLLSERDDFDSAPEEHEDPKSVKSRKNWKQIDKCLKINFSEHSRVELQPSNTLFSTGNLVTMFYLQPRHLKDQASGQILNNLTIDLSSGIIPESPPTEIYDKWTPLHSQSDETLKITDCVGNLVKAINKKSAAGYLESNEMLSNISSKDTEVYVKIFPRSNNHILRYKVIAGGGGWGSKANILVLSPNANIHKGDKIEFYMLTPEDKKHNNNPMSKLPQSLEVIIFERTYEEFSYNSEDCGVEEVLENVFGCGCEAGFKYNNIMYVSSGERLIVLL